MAGALLKPRALKVQLPEPEEDRDDGEGGSAASSPVKMIGFMFLVFSSAMTVSSWHRGYGAVSFIAFSFLDLGLLFHCLRQYAKTPPESPRRELLKVAAWLLVTMLLVNFFQLLELWFLTMGSDHGHGYL